MKITYAFFAAGRYWPDPAVLQASFEDLCSRMGCTDALLVSDGSVPEATGDCIVIVPMSGAVQKQILAAANRFSTAILYSAYVEGNAAPEVSEKMLYANSAPTLMDTWAVLRRTHPAAMLALNAQELQQKKQVATAFVHVRGARVLKIGETEPWVVSNASSTEAYKKRFGVEIVPVQQEELAQLYRGATREQAAPYHTWFTRNSQACVGPNDDDIWAASSMAWALVTLLDKYQAEGAAVACFNLLKEGTNTCLGVSYVNDCTDHIIACECDMDSALTMLMMKRLTTGKLWMANPGLHPGGLVNFSHCTAPICCTGGAAMPCTLRSHHESGIGVSLQVTLPVDRRVTACRISDEASKITVHCGTSVSGPREPVCRTQMYLRFDDFDHYLRTALGCHQVFAFEDISASMTELGRLFGLEQL